MIEQTVPSEFIDLAHTQAEHEEELFARPNVVGVALGHKITEDADTDERAITVLVDTKHDPDLLTDEEMVPKELDGALTDVQEVGVIFAGPAGSVLEAPSQTLELPEWAADGGVALRERLG